MGWMHDFCEYMKLDPIYKRDNHYNMTFAMSYNESENYILPLSHDEVVHLKCSMVGKMPGYEVDKYANLRAGYTFMFGHAGKKLLFMGQEFAQEREWSEARELDWFLLSKPLNKGMHDYVKRLLEIYRKYPAMYRHDNNWGGFEWLSADDKDYSTYAFYRRDESGKNNILFVLNFTPVKREGFRVGVPYPFTPEMLSLLVGTIRKIIPTHTPRQALLKTTPWPQKFLKKSEKRTMQMPWKRFSSMMTIRTTDLVMITLTTFLEWNTMDRCPWLFLNRLWMTIPR